MRHLDNPAVFRRALLGLLAAGLLLRLLLAAATDGSASDLAAFRNVHDLLERLGLDFYSGANPDGRGFSWPYLPGFLPILELVYATSEVTGVSADRLIRLPAIAADIAIAWLVQWHLGWRGASQRVRFGAAALLVASPVGVTLTGAHGQIDPLEWLPVVLAVIAFERLDPGRREVVAGLLVGVGLAIKPPAAVAALALFALTPTWRERLRLTVAGAIAPALAFAPFFLADPRGALSVLEYQSIPGQGGLSMILQPSLALARFAGEEPPDGLNALNDALDAVAPLLVAAGVMAVALLVARRRPQPAEAIAALILAVFVISPNFLFGYLIWILPFALLAGWWRFALGALVLASLQVPFKYASGSVLETLGIGREPGLFDSWLVWGVYIPAGALLWLLMAARLVAWVRERPATA